MAIYAGLDVHKKKCHGVIMDEDGKVLEDEEFENSLRGIEHFFKGYENIEVVIEASFSWRPTYERLEEIGLEPKLAHPHKVRAIAEAKIKTDSIDAKTLTNLLRADLVPESYIPPEKIRKLRDKVRLRTELVREKARLKNKIHAELEKNRIKKENPFTQKNREKLRELGIESVNHYLAVIETLEHRIDTVSEELEEIAEDDEEAQLLMTIPGVGYFSALTILAEIGNVERFPDPEKLCFYAGLVPRVRQSGDKTRLGRIKKEGNKMLRWVLVESVCSHIRHADSELTKYYYRKKREKESKRAAVATARKLLTAIYFMLKRGEEFRPDG